MACFFAVGFVFFIMPCMVSASSSYPSDQAVTDQGVVFTKSAAWRDQTHAGGDYGAEISLKVENAEPAGRVPVDVAVILCSSPGLNNPNCTHPSHKNLREDISPGVKEILDRDWDSLYVSQLPDSTNFMDSNIKNLDPEEFVVKVTVNGVDGYLCPIFIYTQENGAEYKEKYRKRSNWGFVTQNPVSVSNRVTLHLEENDKAVGQAIKNSASDNGIYTLNLSGKSGAAANCTNGAAIATLSAKNFVDIVLRNHSRNNISLIPYGVYTPYPDPVFTSEKNTLYSQIEEAYEQSRSYRPSKDVFQSAKEVLDKQTSGRPKAVVFLTDYYIRNDNSRDDAIAIAGEMRAQGIPVYVMGYGVTDADYIQRLLKPFAFDYDRDHPEADCDYLIKINRSDYGLKEGIETIAQRISGQETNLTFTDYISEYFQVDRTQLPSNFQVQEEIVTDGSSGKTLEKVIIDVKTSDVTQNPMSVKIPVTLKEPYRTSSDYLNTNYIFQLGGRKGAEACFWDSAGTYRNIGGGVDSPYLQPLVSVTPSITPDPDVKTAKLTFDLQGGNPPQGQKLDPVTVAVGTKISEAPGYSLVPIRDNYVFDGWFKEPECVNSVGITLMPDQATTIYAKWTLVEAEDLKKDPTPTPNKNAVVTPSQENTTPSPEKTTVNQNPGKTHARTAVKTGDMTRGPLLYLLLCGAAVIFVTVVSIVIVGRRKHKM